MSYVIDEEGNVQDAVVDDFGGHRDFKRKALHALKQWKYEPAMKNGQPTQQCQQAVKFDFMLDGKSGASRQFIAKYRDIDEMFQNGEVEEAEALLTELRENDTLNHYENA